MSASGSMRARPICSSRGKPDVLVRDVDHRRYPEEVQECESIFANQGSSAMTTIETSPQLYARTGGLLYLLIIVFGGFAEGFVMNSLIVAGDASAAAHNILGSPGLWNL